MNSFIVINSMAYFSIGLVTQTKNMQLSSASSSSGNNNGSINESVLYLGLIEAKTKGLSYYHAGSISISTYFFFPIGKLGYMLCHYMVFYLSIRFYLPLFYFAPITLGF